MELKSNTSERLKYLMQTRSLRQVDILKLCEPVSKRIGISINKNDLSQYVNGKNTPGQFKLTLLGIALNVSESWLMGCDVPMEREEAAAVLSGIDRVEKLIGVCRLLPEDALDKILDYAELLLLQQTHSNG